MSAMSENDLKTKSNRLLRVDHVAKRLEMSPRTVRMKAETGELPGFKLSKESRIWYFRESEIDELVEKQHAKYCGDGEDREIRLVSK